MKVRNGFVSNSSSSSFICDVCGEVESGYDCSLSDFDMSQCEHGHVFHDGHIENGFNDQTTEFKFKYLKSIQEKYIRELHESLSSYLQKKSGEKELEEWEQNSIAKNPNWLDETISKYENIVSEEKQSLEEMCEDFANLDEEDWIDKYEEDILDAVCDNGVPEEFCPVCQKLKEYKKDPEFQKYLELKLKFGDIQL